MLTGWVMVGSPDGTTMALRPDPIAKWILSSAAVALASWIAARSVHSPCVVAQTPLPTAASGLFPALFTVNVAPEAAEGMETDKHTATTNWRVFTMKVVLRADEGVRGTQVAKHTPQKGAFLVNRSARNPRPRRQKATGQRRLAQSCGLSSSSSASTSES